MEIKIIKEKKELTDELYATCVERIIRKNSVFKGANEEKGNLKDMAQGIFSIKTERYEIPNEGVIVYQTPLTLLDKYIAVVELEGFNESKSKVFQEIKNNLERVIGFNTGREAGKEFLPELYNPEK